MYFDLDEICEYSIEEINGKNTGIVIDKDQGGPSVTNTISKIAQKLNVDQIIYRDSLGIWDFWSKKTGFVSLAKSPGKPLTDIDEAIESARKITN